MKKNILKPIAGLTLAGIFFASSFAFANTTVKPVQDDNVTVKTTSAREVEKAAGWYFAVGSGYALVVATK